MAPAEKTAFEKWQDSINAFAADPMSSAYDTPIQVTANGYNQHLASAKGYRRLFWKLIKAMAWTESGRLGDSAWATRPMQIGNPGDPGLAALLSGREGGELIMPPIIAAGLTAQNARSLPTKNIEAGVGYLLMRAASYAFVNVEDKSDMIRDYIVQRSDSLSAIAAKNGSTIEELKILNPSARTLRPGEKLKIRKAKIQKVITGFAVLTNVAVAQLYNTGDPRYADKLSYCLSILEPPP